MKAFLTSHYLEPNHFERFKKLLGKNQAEKALFITSGAVPYGLNPKPEWLRESLEEMSQLTKEFDEISLEETKGIPDSLDEYNFIFVSGGNSFYLAYKLAETGFDEKIKEFIGSGGVYAGSSAGAIILMENIENFIPADEPDKAPRNEPPLGLIDFAIIPHADSDKYSKLMADIAENYRKEGTEVIMLGDHQVLIVDGSKREVI